MKRSVFVLGSTSSATDRPALFVGFPSYYAGVSLPILTVWLVAFATLQLEGEYE